MISRQAENLWIARLICFLTRKARVILKAHVADFFSVHRPGDLFAGPAVNASGSPAKGGSLIGSVPQTASELRNLG